MSEDNPMDIEGESLKGKRPNLRSFLLPIIAIGAIFGTIQLLQAGAGQGREGAGSVTISNAPYKGAVKVGDPSPDFTVSTLEGKTVSLGDFRGKGVILNFWATWCPPCRAEMPEFQALYREKGGDDFVIMAVDVQEPPDPVKRFVEEFGLTFPILMDAEGDLSTLYKVVALPTTFFIDGKGTIRAINVGSLNRSAILKKLQLTLENS